ncbi:hypothetical protein ACHAXS_013394 [Conticribra weissflogii]
MKKTPFLQITAVIVYINKQPPSFHFEGNYIPLWINSLDKNISSWLNQYCPGFMFVPQKPHPSSNEYHSIADCKQGKPIMWQVKLHGGKIVQKMPTSQSTILGEVLKWIVSFVLRWGFAHFMMLMFMVGINQKVWEFLAKACDWTAH